MALPLGLDTWFIFSRSTSLKDSQLPNVRLEVFLVFKYLSATQGRESLYTDIYPTMCGFVGSTPGSEAVIKDRYETPVQPRLVLDGIRMNVCYLFVVALIYLDLPNPRDCDNLVVKVYLTRVWNSE